jgi:lysophospholipid acyltransferase (LPLAT)-like uncharacterized protein
MGDAIEKDRASRKRPLRRRLRRRLAKVGVGLLTYVVPAIYQSYMWLVYATSRVEHENTDLLWLLRERYGGLVGIMWHQEVFMVAWSFRRFEGHTLASTGDLGDIITAVLQANDFVVLRGGSTKSKSRKRPVLHDMIEHMRSVPGVAFGITCDGSKGPAYRVKKGSIVIAHACSKPMITARTWCKRRINLRGWDRSYIPLPFNHIVQTFEGPYFVPPGADDPELLEAFRSRSLSPRNRERASRADLLRPRADRRSSRDPGLRISRRVAAKMGRSTSRATPGSAGRSPGTRGEARGSDGREIQETPAGSRRTRSMRKLSSP